MPRKMRHAPTTKTPNEEARIKRKSGTYDTHYRKLRAYVMKSNPLCMLRGPECLGFSSECHHLRYGQGITSNDLMAVCTACHQQLEREKRGGL